MSNEYEPTMYFEVKKSAKMRSVERKYGKKLEDLLFEMYVDKEMTQDEIAKEIGISQPTLAVWMAKLRVPTTAHINARKLLEKYRKKRG